MDIIQAAKFLGAGMATIAFVGSGIGIGIVFGNYISAALRNPGAAQSQFTNLYIGYALCELQGLFGLLIALILMYT
jgi:F-type H+-transporting ATPase subunit c